ncbi:MAG: sensor histidine kinase [Chloroflexi bacterium]|nr:sensor histidine kinase [Chloroflexota bacterium]
MKLPPFIARLLPSGDSFLQWAAYAVTFGVLLTYIIDGRSSSTDPVYYTSITLFSLMVIINIAWMDLEQTPQHDWAFLIVSAALIVATFLVSQTGLVIYLVFMLTSQAYSVKSPPQASVFTALLVMAFLVSLAILGFSAEDYFSLVGSFAIGLVFVITLTISLRASQKKQHRVEQLLNELQQAQEREKELAAAAERVHLAREIHDGLGHHLTALNIQLQAAAKLIERDPSRARSVIDVCLAEAQAAMQEVRRSVAVMRRTPLDGRSLDEAVARLVADFNAHSQLESTLRVHGSVLPLDTRAALTLYRAAQEGLTNAQKYGHGAASVTVDLFYHPGRVHLQVANDGDPVEESGRPSSNGSGFGLAGLRERATHLGGTLSAGPREGGGFILEMSLPTLQETVS